MRIAVVLALFAGAFLVAPGSASALTPALSDQAAMSRDAAGGLVEQVRRKVAHPSYARYSSKRYRRPYNWTYYPYWRPYQYRYWQFYYPYGGPLF
jgi:hypothetical protein